MHSGWLRAAGVFGGVPQLLAGARTRPIEGSHLVDLLGVSERDGGGLRILFEQLVDDILPEALNIEQFAEAHRGAGPLLRLVPGAPAERAGHHYARCWSRSSTSPSQIAAERNQDHLRAVVNVLKHRGPFAAFVREVAETSRAMLASHGAGDREWQKLARRFVHTCKGNLAHFGLSAAAALLHQLEEAELLGPATLAQLQQVFRDLLAQQANVWRISFDDSVLEYALRATDFDRLQAELGSAATAEAAA